MISKLSWRKVLIAFLVFPLISLCTFSGSQKAKAWSTLDQFTLTADGYWRIQSHQIIGQSFRPTYNKLDGVGVYAGILPVGPATCVLTVSVYNATTLPPVKIAETTMTIPKAETYNIADIGPVDTVPDARYEMHVTASSTYAYWLVSTTDVYPRGASIIDSVADPSQDFIFATFGYNDTPPEESSPAPEADVSPTPTGGDAATDATASTTTTDTSSGSTGTTSTSVAAPTNLNAQVVTDGTSSSIDLAWTASKTTDITGYSVLRSTSETSGFVEIGATDKKTLNFRDDKAVTDQTYYYVVRAYKDGTVSKNSNVASAKITDTIAPTKPANFKVVSQNETEIVFTWDKTSDSDIANYILTIADGSGADAKVLDSVETIAKDETTYTLKLADHATLAKDIEYTFYLQAKDVSNNFSEKAETNGQFATAKKTTSLWLWIGLGAVVLVAAGLTTFLIIRKRKKKTAVV